MNTPKLYLEKLEWQLDLIADLGPEIVGKTIQEYYSHLSADQAEWAGDIIKHFVYRCFEGFGSFLGKIEQEFRTAKSSLGAVEEEIFREWREFSAQSDDELLLSAMDTGLFVEFSPKDKSVNINSLHRKEGRRKLFDHFDLYDLGQKDATNPEREYSLIRLARQLTRSGPYRRYTFDQEAIKRLAELGETSPNFMEVTGRVIDSVSLAITYSRPIRITPILLVGEPGIGKSHYTEQLSRCLGVPIVRVAVDNLQEGAGIAGSSFIYSNSQPGVVFKVLTEKDHVSPLVILDELDKAEYSMRGDPLSPLHNLLEPVSAKQFGDGSVELPIDASHIIWIATANYIARIPLTLRSRFEIFEISPQSKSTKEAILRGLCEELEDEYTDIEFSDKALDALVDKTPREQRQLLQRALARAVRLGEAIVTLDHLKQVAPDIRPQPPKTGLGYL
ncbi:MAG: AAA family ATPase [Actinomycetota bacterium]|jgi:ATP-dependent Lon protease|nr:AAA family ATPase [Actinomycetota bacterium]